MKRIYIKILSDNLQNNFLVWVLNDIRYYDYIQTDKKGNEFFYLIDLHLEAKEKDYDYLLNSFYKLILHEI